MCLDRGLTIGLGNHAVRVPQQPVGGLGPERRARLVLPEDLLQQQQHPSDCHVWRRASWTDAVLTSGACLRMMPSLWSE